MSFLREGPVNLIGRLVRSEALNNEQLIVPAANRVSFEFDAIDARLEIDQALATIVGKAERSRLAVLKVLTTSEHFCHLSGTAEVRDGQWYWISLLPRGKQPGPFAWSSSLGDAGYDENVPFVLNEISFLFSEGESPLSPIGATVSNARALAQVIANGCSFPASAMGMSGHVRSLFRAMNPPDKIVVRDVGQASFCSAVDQHGSELFHLDAGWPISYNKKTVSIKPKPKISDVPVILSHWDWDHLHGYHAIQGLAGGAWITPVQRLGPGAKLVADNLAKAGRLLGFTLAKLSAGPVRLGRCKRKGGNLNQTGLWIETTLNSGKTILYVGDADYDPVDLKISKLPDFMVTTHHGAKFSGSVPPPNHGKGSCIVSVGKGNGYGHPSSLAVAQYSSAGWAIEYTCDWGATSRGDRYLGP